MNQPDPKPTAAAWIDGDPLMEAIASAVWEHCERGGNSTVFDDPRNIAAVAAAAVPAAQSPADRAALRARIAEAIRDAACAGDCGKTEEECAKERIQPFVWHHGRLAVVEGEPEQFAAAVLAVLPEPADRAAVRAEALREAADFLRGLRLTGTAITAKEMEAELRRLAGEQPAQDEARRCPSCDHKGEYHDADNRCWFTVDHGVPESNLVCPGAPRRAAA